VLEPVLHKVVSVWTGISGCSELGQIHPVDKTNWNYSGPMIHVVALNN